MNAGADVTGPTGAAVVKHSAEGEAVARRPTVAIIGASADRRKFGNKAVRAYAEEGWEVWPVNPGGGTIEGLPVYARVAGLPGVPDRASIYLREGAALGALDDLAALQQLHDRDIADVYLNPGVGRRSVRERADELGLHRVSRCSIRAIGRVPAEFGAE